MLTFNLCMTMNLNTILCDKLSTFRIIDCFLLCHLIVRNNYAILWAINRIVSAYEEPEVFEANPTHHQSGHYKQFNLWIQFISTLSSLSLNLLSNCSFWHSDQQGNGKQIGNKWNKSWSLTHVIDISGKTSVFVCWLCLWCSRLYQ